MSLHTASGLRRIDTTDLPQPTRMDDALLDDAAATGMTTEGATRPRLRPLCRQPVWTTEGFAGVVGLLCAIAGMAGLAGYLSAP